MFYLTESFTEIIYHRTNYENFLKILQEDTFYLAGQETVLLKDKKVPVFYASFSRSLTSSYFEGMFDYVIIELDGRKLSQTFKGEPFEYYDFYKGKKSGEFEDRLISVKKNRIENFSKYIRHVYLLINGERLNMIQNVRMLLQIILLLRRKNIPFSIHYMEKASWTTLTRFVLEKTKISLKEFINILKKHLSSKEGYHQISRRDVYGKKYIDMYKITKKIFNKEKIDQKELHALINFIIYPSDFKNYFEMFMHNVRFPSHPFYPYYVKMVKLLRKHNIETPEQLYEIFKNYYDKLREKRD